MTTSWIHVALVVSAVGLYRLWNLSKAREQRRLLGMIGTVGYGGDVFSYITAISYFRDARSVLHEGYSKFKGKLFKVAQVDRWLVIATGGLVDELKTASENQLSLEAAMVDILQSDYTLGAEIRTNMYHLGVIRSLTTGRLASMLSAMANEAHLGFADLVDTKLDANGGNTDSWTKIAASDIMTFLVCRVINRAFVGAPLCRNEDYCNINIHYAHHVMFGAAFLNLFPKFLKPLVGTIFKHVSGLQKRALSHLLPVIQSRRQSEKSGAGKPEDMLSWLMDAAPSDHQSESSLSLRILNVNFFALHTTAMSTIHSLYHLAARREYIAPLRRELEENFGNNFIDSCIDWDVEKLDKCWQLDSFLKESLRLSGMGALSLPRMAIVPYSFSDGSVVPPGTLMSAAPTATHMDPEYYEDPAPFDGFRFFKLRQKAMEMSDSDTMEEFKFRSTSLSSSFLAFGGGRHACPGWFLAALEIKLLLAHIILKYDVRMENEGVRPEDTWFGPVCIPARNVSVLFRRRV